MDAFFKFLNELIVSIFNGSFSLSDISKVYADNSSGFEIPGLILFIVLIFFLVALSLSLIVFIVFAIKKILAHRPKGYDERKMMEEIERLNLELYDLAREKDQILSLAKEAEGIYSPLIEGGGKDGKSGLDGINKNGRFSKLYVVDEKYKNGNHVAKISEEFRNMSLKDFCDKFRNFASSQMRLYYTPETIRQFVAALGTGKLVILEGVSGTGKTSLPYCFGRFIKNPSSICSVQPSWRDRSELLGYYNDFTKKFVETEFLRSVYEATFRNDVSLVILDEMNLARVEYYFAEFLSIMEIPNQEEWLIDVVASQQDNDPKHLKGGKLHISTNTWFVGTANNDDSTFAITDKVYDRAISLFFEDKNKPFNAPFTEAMELPASHLIALFNAAIKNRPLSTENKNKFNSLGDFVLNNFKIAFGNRILKQIRRFVPIYVACGGTELDALDFLFKTKILKKIEVLSVTISKQDLNKLNNEITKLFGVNEFKLSRSKIADLIKIAR